MEKNNEETRKKECEIYELRISLLEREIKSVQDMRPIIEKIKEDSATGYSRTENILRRIIPLDDLGKSHEASGTAFSESMEKFFGDVYTLLDKKETILKEERDKLYKEFKQACLQ